MPNQKKQQPKTWHGDEVQRKPDGEAERAAERAEGNGPLAVEKSLGGTGAPSADAEKPSPPRRRTGDDEADKIAEAAEAHRARRASGEGPPRKTL